MTKFIILTRHDVSIGDGPKENGYLEFEFTPEQFAVAQACFQILAARDDNDNVALLLKNDNGLPELLSNKEEFRQAVSRQRQQMQPQGNGLIDPRIMR